MPSCTGSWSSPSCWPPCSSPRQRAPPRCPRTRRGTRPTSTTAEAPSCTPTCCAPRACRTNAQTPVIMTVSPYTSHSGASPPVDYDPTRRPARRTASTTSSTAPTCSSAATPTSIVDLPGFGGSGGCTDWGGPASRAASRRAVEWAAAQPWSTGKVGTYGKSYDGWTGLMALAQQPKGLAAVVAAGARLQRLPLPVHQRRALSTRRRRRRRCSTRSTSRRARSTTRPTTSSTARADRRRRAATRTNVAEQQQDSDDDRLLEGRAT